MTVDAYIVSLDDEQRRYIERWHYLITQAAPLLDVRMWDYQGDMIGYGTYHYKYESGKEGDWFTIGLASRKDAISLYTVGMEDGKYITEKYKDKFPKGTVFGNSSIKVQNPDLVDEQVITDLVKETVPLVEEMTKEMNK